MGSKKKRKSLVAGEEEPAKRAGASNARRSSTGGGSNSPLLWSAQGVTVTLPHNQVSQQVEWPFTRCHSLDRRPHSYVF
jgi:hypothetical protein